MVAIGFVIYAAAAVWTHTSVNLLVQNLLRSNQVALPLLGRPLQVLSSGASHEESTALVLARAPMPLDPNQAVVRDLSNLIYPMAGRNGLHFTPERCTSCNLCAYVCPTNAVSTLEQEGGYLRVFDLKACVYCGLCEAACPTNAIQLTVNEQPFADKFFVQALVERQNCQLCQRKIPQTDLLAERIYQANLEDTLDETKLRQILNPQGVCQECQTQVLEAEDRICG